MFYGFVTLRSPYAPPRFPDAKTITLWNALSHPNILSLTGVRADTSEGEFITISE
jgi:hypothetical protein